MPIFRYTFKKILVSPSTWVVLGLTWIILGITWCIFPTIVSSNVPGFTWSSDLVKLVYLPLWKQLTFFSLIGLMLLIFIGIKSVQIFRDEIEDGTLLILVSKPISRSRIWLEKWLTFQVVVISYLILSILIPGLILLVPSIGGGTFFVTMLPYFFILFGIGLIFDLIFTSIVLLISLIMSSKATIAIMIVFAAMTNIFASLIDQIITIPAQYFQISQSLGVYHQLQHKLSSEDFKWFNDERVKDPASYKAEIDAIMKQVYTITMGKDPSYYPNKYDPIGEQKAINQLTKLNTPPSGYTQDQLNLIKHISAVANVFRQWKEQSYEELMTGVGVGINGDENGNLKHIDRNKNGAGPGENTVIFNVEDVFLTLNAKYSKSEIDNMNNKVTEKRVLRYFNVFYQLYYLFNGIINEDVSLYTDSSEFQKTDDPFLVSFNSATGSVDLNSGQSKIISFPALITVYALLGFVLLGASWYIFKHRDFA